MAYGSQSLSLAALEILVHADPADLPDDMVATAAEIAPEHIKTIGENELPPNWRALDPSPHQLVQMGRNWLESDESMVLAVPSVVIPEECNYLINPDHPDFSTLLIHRPIAFEFDPRLGVTGDRASTH